MCVRYIYVYITCVDSRSRLVAVHVRRSVELRVHVRQNQTQGTLSDGHGIHKGRNAERQVRVRSSRPVGGLPERRRLLRSVLHQSCEYDDLSTFARRVRRVYGERFRTKTRPPVSRSERKTAIFPSNP